MNAIRKLVDDDNLMVPERFRAGHPHADWQTLRKECPVYYCEPTGYRPFWAITKYQDIVEVEKRSDIFLNEPRFVIMPAAFEDSSVDFDGDLYSAEIIEYYYSEKDWNRRVG